MTQNAGTDELPKPSEAGQDTKPLQPDLDEYRPYIEDWDLTEEEANEWLQNLWNIMSAFVDLGFGLDPVQSVLADTIETLSKVESDALEQKGHTETFTDAAGKESEE